MLWVLLAVVGFTLGWMLSSKPSTLEEMGRKYDASPSSPVHMPFEAENKDEEEPVTPTGVHHSVHTRMEEKLEGADSTMEEEQEEELVISQRMASINRAALNKVQSKAKTSSLQKERDEAEKEEKRAKRKARNRRKSKK